jgi:hypothetical protein
MNDQNHHTTSTTNLRRNATMKTTATILATAALLAVAVGCGPNSPAAPAAAPAPVTTTVTAPPKTVTAPPKTVTVTEVPQACLDALDKADAALGSAGDGFDILSDVLTAASQFDLEGMDAGSKKLEALTPRLGTQIDGYVSARNACKAAKS